MARIAVIHVSFMDEEDVQPELEGKAIPLCSPRPLAEAIGLIEVLIDPPDGVTTAMVAQGIQAPQPVSSF